MIKPLRLVIFDVGNVLIRHDNFILVRRLAANCSRHMPARKMLDHLIRETRYLSERDGRADALYSDLVSNYGFSLDKAAFERLFCSHFSDDLDMAELVQKLAESYRVAVLSNTNRVHWNHWITNYAVLQFPHARYASHELGTAKPDPVCFRHVLEREGYDAQNTIFIDDQAENTAAAARLGMAAITFTDRVALESSLLSVGIHIQASNQKGQSHGTSATRSCT